MSTDAEHAELVRVKIERLRRDLGGEPAEGTFTYDLARLLERAERAERERDALLAKVTRVGLLAGSWRMGLRDLITAGDISKALADPIPSRCTQQSPLAALTKPQCTKPLGHEPPHVFTSHDGRTPLEMMPK